MSEAEETVACPACLQGLSAPPIVASTFSYRERDATLEWQYRLLRCASCGMGRLFPAPSAAALRALYAGGYDAYDGDAETDAQSPARRLKFLMSELDAAALRSDRVAMQRLLGVLSHALEVAGGRSVPLTASVPLMHARDASILDFGCGAGFWLMAMTRHGYTNLSAFDIAQPALDRLQARGVRCFADDPAGLPDLAFDCIRLEHVLEHLVNPIEALTMLRAKLRPRGTIVLTVPNYGSSSARRFEERWRALKLPHHLSHFTIHALQRISRRAGLQIRRSRFLPISELALPRPGGSAARVAWRFRRHGYHARAYNSPSADYLSLELEQR